MSKLMGKEYTGMLHEMGPLCSAVSAMGAVGGKLKFRAGCKAWAIQEWGLTPLDTRLVG